MTGGYQRTCQVRDLVEISYLVGGFIDDIAGKEPDIVGDVCLSLNGAVIENIPIRMQLTKVNHIAHQT